MAMPNIFFFFIILLLLLAPFVLALGNVTLGSTLSTNDQINSSSWLSPSGEFAFGFRPINNTNLFLLAIWFNKIPNKTVVWNTNMPDPAVPSGSRVQLTRTGLSLTNPQGQAIWSAASQENVSYGTMMDTGNFVLASSNSSYLWQSFDNPTDTLLPNQTMGINGKLSSRLTQTNYTKGRFELYFDNNANLLLSQIGWPTESRYTDYFRVSSNSTTSDNGSASLVFDTSNVYVETIGGNYIPLGSGWSDSSTLDVNRYYYRATLDHYGVFTLYSFPKGSDDGNQDWSILEYVPNNICNDIFSDLGSGSCGYNSYCSIENQRPTCKCLEGYSLVDPNNLFGGCEPDVSLGCGADDVESKTNPKEVYEFQVMQNIDWPLGDYEKLSNYTQDECQTSCLYDCNCAVAIFDNNGICWKKRLLLANGRGNVVRGQTALIKTRILARNNNLHGHVVKEQPALLGSLIGSLVINTLLGAIVVGIILSRPKRSAVQVSSALDVNLHSFTYEALKDATLGFNEELGRGSFGIVYKGNLKSGTNNSVVAVKRLDRLAQEREKEFRTELSAIGKTCHKNLVRLIGFCDEGVHRLLVYEFMSNGTLADIIFGELKPIWVLRFNLALGIARGLVYLHEECDTPIIHCDIKPQNILIDEHLIPKISDFGLSKLLYSNQSRTRTMIRGTRGYVEPEWFKSVPVNAKVDVYSYGVMLLEIICCRRNVMIDMDEREEEKAVLIDWAYDCYMEDRIDILVDNDKEAIADIGRLKKWVKIAILCIQENPETRPSMKTVMQMLEGLVEVPNPPLPSSFFTSTLI